MSPTGNRREFTIVREASVKDGRYKELVLQRLHFDDGAVQLRFGYYVISKKKGFEGKRIWGRSALMLDQSQLDELLLQAADWAK
ncbi:hypothetical protein EIP75_21775 [Aquabacterium soli]|uniref:Uncharacterized protein n=1 Tax=Aquabacterium soli TaxID=2493092 RepID=A0A3R8T1Y7_9BURK|nr:hypothetical protein [Aquabacterium soli]RRS01103.1 hypothetical protein EIP75_21775 [Aquabacterium soli]